MKRLTGCSYVLICIIFGLFLGFAPQQESSGFFEKSGKQHKVRLLGFERIPEKATVRHYAGGMFIGIYADHDFTHIPGLKLFRVKANSGLALETINKNRDITLSDTTFQELFRELDATDWVEGHGNSPVMFDILSAWWLVFSFEDGSTFTLSAGVMPYSYPDMDPNGPWLIQLNGKVFNGSNGGIGAALLDIFFKLRPDLKRKN